MRKNISIKILWSSFTLVFFVAFLAQPVSAAVLSLGSESTYAVGEKMAVKVLLDPQNESVNSVDIAMQFPENLIRFAGYDSQNTAISLWVTPPKVATAGVVHFSGVTPGGLDRVYDPQHPEQKELSLLTLYFIPKYVGSGELQFQEVRLLKNDGKGTTVDSSTVTKKEFVISNNKLIDEGGESEEKNLLPEPFNIQILERSIFGKTPRLAVFSTEDGETGISHYEIKSSAGKYKIGTSPYPLPYRLLSYSLGVRAYDFDGNYREETVVVPGEKPYAILMLLVLLLVIIKVSYMQYKSRLSQNIHHE